MKLNIFSWAVFSVFAASAFYFEWQEGIFQFKGTLGIGKVLVWLTFLAFLAYSIYCSLKENIFKSVAKIIKFHWGRQIGIDLYLGLFLTLSLIYFHEGTLVIVLLWLIPILLYANLATLLYFAIHFDSIAARFLT